MLALVLDRTVTIQVADDLGGGADVVERNSSPLDEVARRVGQEADAGAALFEAVTRALIDRDITAEIAEQEPGGETAERIKFVSPFLDSLGSKKRQWFRVHCRRALCKARLPKSHISSLSCSNALWLVNIGISAGLSATCWQPDRGQAN